MKLSPATVYLWFSFVEDIQDEQLLAEYQNLLPREELDRLGRFRFDTHKKRYLVGRALIRTILSRCTGLDPKQIVLSREEYGRPYLLYSGRNPPPQFSLSYTDGLVGVALTIECRVGIDVENTSRELDCLEIAENYFSPAEYRELKQLSESPLKRRFFELWTLKEAYVKAQGSGLYLPLDEVSFLLGEENTNPSKVISLMTDEGKQWQFGTCRPSEQHRAAFCVCQDTQIPLQVICTRAIPLVSEDDLTLC